MSQQPYRFARRVFWIVDNGSSHRGDRAAARLQAKWPLAPSSLPFRRISTYVEHREHDDHVALNGEVHGVREAPHQRSADS
jgi:hypothetical protein